MAKQDYHMTVTSRVISGAVQSSTCAVPDYPLMGLASEG